MVKKILAVTVIALVVVLLVGAISQSENTYPEFVKVVPYREPNMPCYINLTHATGVVDYGIYVEKMLKINPQYQDRNQHGIKRTRVYGEGFGGEQGYIDIQGTPEELLKISPRGYRAE